MLISPRTTTTTPEMISKKGKNPKFFKDFRARIDMIMDWHLTLLSYISKNIECIELGGEEEFKKQSPPTFFAPFMFPKEVHKTLKNLDLEFLEKS